MTLILKSNTVYTGRNLTDGIIEYISRVQDDGGIIVDNNDLRDAFLFSNFEGLNHSNCFSVTSPAWGVKTDPNGDVIKMYSLFGSDGDILATEDAFKVSDTQYRGVVFRGSRTQTLVSQTKIKSGSLGAMMAVKKGSSTVPRAPFGFYDELSNNISTRLIETGTGLYAYYNTAVYEASLVDTPLRTNSVNIIGANAHNDVLSLYDRGIEAIQVAITEFSTDGGFSFYIGKNRTDLTNNVYEGEIYETWAFNNAPNSVVAEVGAYLSSKYKNS